MLIPTVKVKLGDDYMLINESDFDPKEHELFDAPEADPDPDPNPDPAPASDPAADPAKEVAPDTAPPLPDDKDALRKIAHDMGLKVLVRDTVADLQDKITEAKAAASDNE